MPAEFVSAAHNAPWWASQEALAHTLAYDATIMADYALPAERAAKVKAPTLVMSGGASWQWMQNSAHALTEALPDGQELTLAGQEHNVDASVMASALKISFKARARNSWRGGALMQGGLVAAELKFNLFWRGLLSLANGWSR